MRRPVLSGLLLGGALLLLQAASVLADDPGAGITVEPAEVTAGQTILLAGNSLEPDDERVIVLQGESITVNLGTAKTDADGMLSQEIQIPGHLPSGSYQLQAIGDETLQVELKVTAGEGGAAVEPEPDEGAATNRQRPGIEVGVIVVAAVLLGGLGALLVVGAERFRGGATV
jgi:hypothetical protein